MSNRSLDFLNMLKPQISSEYHISATPASSSASAGAEKEKDISFPGKGLIAVIDTETNWNDEVMSIGVAIADDTSFKCVGKLYYIFEPECRIGGLYSNVLNRCSVNAISCDRRSALSEISSSLKKRGINKIFAYNARFDCNHLPELSDFDWYDIMRIAAYKQYNRSIPESLPCCKSGRLKTNYGVEPILRLLSGNPRYLEVHNAVEDAVDELSIVELLGLPLEEYECARIN